MRRPRPLALVPCGVLPTPSPAATPRATRTCVPASCLLGSIQGNNLTEAGKQALKAAAGPNTEVFTKVNA